jgi:hypothetical protein
VNSFEEKLLAAMNRIADAVEGIQQRGAADAAREKVLEVVRGANTVAAYKKPMPMADMEKALGVKKRTVKDYCEILKLDPAKVSAMEIPKLKALVDAAKSRRNNNAIRQTNKINTAARKKRRLEKF